MRRIAFYTFFLLLLDCYNAVHRLRNRLSERPGTVAIGSQLEITPRSAVAQLDDQARPIKLIPTDIAGSWELPVLSNLDSHDMSRPRDHVLPNGLKDPSRGGTNIYPGTLISLEGHNYLESDPPPYLPPQPHIAVPAGSSPFHTVPTSQNDVDSWKDVLHSRKEPLSAPFASYNPVFVHGTSAKDSSALWEPPTYKTWNTPSSPKTILPPFTPPVALSNSLLSTQSSDMTLKDLTSLYSAQLSKMNFMFPTLGTSNFKLPIYKLSPNLPDLPGFSTMLSSVTNSTSSNTNSEGDSFCIRDYSSSLCPQGWRKKARLCVASNEYTGPCPYIMDFSRYSINEKRSWALQCKADWPCKYEILSCAEGRDYTDMCPYKWIATSRGCVPASQYTGVCKDPVYPMASFTQEQKQNFESLCEVSWPCRSMECDMDYTALCPLSYKLDATKNVCVADNMNTARCVTTPSNVYHWSVLEKQSWSAKCDARWPCQIKRPIKESITDCTRDYTLPCPADWENINLTGVCKAPESLNIGQFMDNLVHDVNILMTENLPPDCRPSPLNITVKHTVTQHVYYLTFDAWSLSDKQKFSTRCSIFWRCIDDRDRQSTYPALGFQGCPVGFRGRFGSDDQILCESTSPQKVSKFYYLRCTTKNLRQNNSCETTRNFSRMSVKELESLTRLCGYQWNNSTAISPMFLKGADVPPPNSTS